MPFFIGELGGAFFYDTGNVFERPSDFAFKDFTHSVGPGLRLQTPLGPARFDIGINLFPKTRLSTTGTPVRESRVHFFFTLGNAF
jgi:outer membrane translocation and assembly module TamA